MSFTANPEVIYNSGSSLHFIWYIEIKVVDEESMFKNALTLFAGAVETLFLRLLQPPLALIPSCHNKQVTWIMESSSKSLHMFLHNYAVALYNSIHSYHLTQKSSGMTFVAQNKEDPGCGVLQGNSCNDIIVYCCACTGVHQQLLFSASLCASLQLHGL